MTEQSNDAEAKPALDAAAAEAPAAPVHRGPPIVVAEEVLSDRGAETAVLLASTLGSLAIECAGREDTPWALVDAANVHAACEKCRDGELKTDMLNLLLAVDWVEKIQVIYVLYSTSTNRKVILKTDLPAESPAVDTVWDLWEAAGWYEREAHDLFGVDFPGNGDMAPLLLYDEFEGHPGLKSYPLNDYEEW
jgi:NADH:ubiquinone oxidoreductase subunit C